MNPSFRATRCSRLTPLRRGRGGAATNPAEELATKRHKESQKEAAAGEGNDNSRPPGGRVPLHGISFSIYFFVHVGAFLWLPELLFLVFKRASRVNSTNTARIEQSEIDCPQDSPTGRDTRQGASQTAVATGVSRRSRHFCRHFLPFRCAEANLSL